MATSRQSGLREPLGRNADPRTVLRECFETVRSRTERLCDPLAVEDYVVQSMPEASPVKWHLAHTTWFFETFVLEAAASAYQPFDPQYRYLFNSYYNAIGEQYPRSQRGLLSRPTVEEVYQYRRYVDRHMAALLDGGVTGDAAAVLEVGLHHEQQHQELMLTDLKHLFGINPRRPAYQPRPETDNGASSQNRRGQSPPSWVIFPGGIGTIGHDGVGFCYDNECPQHEVLLRPFQLADRPVTNGEYLAFMDDGGYRRPELWLAEGWDTVRSHQWQAPLYWEWRHGRWWCMTLSGMQPVDPAEPVCHVSYYEADAYARWAGARLPSEAEWETAAQKQAISGHFAEDGRFHPRPAGESAEARDVRQLFGDVWEWTASPYTPYPGYQPPQGALGEYNGKFMCNQMVLRGGSCATPQSHLRASYRNFFPPSVRWQFAGFRLAADADQ